jgi:general nucleoside transport system permease protein
VAVSLYLLWRRRNRSGIVALVVGALIIVLYATTSSVPQELVSATPYVITLFVLVLASQRLRMPAADGLPWRRGGR